MALTLGIRDDDFPLRGSKSQEPEPSPSLAGGISPAVSLAVLCIVFPLGNALRLASLPSASGPGSGIGYSREQQVS